MRNKNQMSILLCLVVALTNLSQLPFFVDNGSTQTVTYLCWGSLFLACCLQKNLRIAIKIFKFLAAFAAIIMVSVLLGEILGINYSGTRMNYCLLITAGIFFISSFISDFNIDDLSVVYRAYIVSATVVAIVIYLNYFQSTGFDFASKMYEYGSKNSSSQIVLTAIILSVFDLKAKNKMWKLVNFFCICVNMVILLLMRSRASIIGIVLIVVMVFFDKGIDKRIRRIVLIASIVFIGILIFNEDVYDTVINDIMFASRDRTDLDDLSSGRVSEWEAFPGLFAEHPFLGRGRYKVEAFPLSVLVQYGLLFGLPIIALGIYPMVFSIKRRALGKHYQILMVTSAAYLLNGIFEELSPFGPGVKCYFIWMMLGILMRSYEYERQLCSPNTKPR